MKKLFTMILLVMLSSLTFGQAYPFDMIAQNGSTGSDYSYDVFVDNSGNKYITGKFKTEIDFGNGVVVTPVDNYDGFVAKYDKENNIQWAKAFGGYSADEGDAITVDADGNVIVAGVFFGSVVFGTDTLKAQGNWDVVVIKFDANGNYLWMNQGYTENQDKPTDIQVDSHGNYIVAGYFDVNDSLTLPFNFNGLEIYSKGERDAFVIKMNANGNPIWGITGGGIDNDYSGEIVLDRNDNIYLVGYYDEEDATFGSTTLTNVDGYDVFLTKINSSGSYQWATSATGPGDAKGYALDFVDNGNSQSGYILITGLFEDSLYAGPSNELFASNGDDDIFVLSYTEDGDYLDGFSFGGDDEDQAKTIEYIQGSNGDFYVAGISKSNLVIANDTLTNYGGRDMLIMRMHGDSLLWAQNYGGSSYDYLNAGVIDDNGVVYFAGNFKSSPAEFTPYSLTSAGSYDLWLGQMSEPTSILAPTILAITDVPNDQGGKVRIEITANKLTKSFSVWRQIGTTDNWDAVGSFEGIYQSNYSFVAPTLGDSTVEGIHWSTFKVSAHTSDVHNYFMSDPVSGYSIDNLAPAVPGGIIAIGHEDKVELSWDDNGDKDFKYYAIYRSLDSEFDPDTMNTYTYSTIESSFNDVNVDFGETYFYRIVAVDFAGNQSDYSENVYALVTDVDSEIEIPTVYELGQNYPNPFNPSTVINFSIPENGLVTLKVFNILGQEVAQLVNEVKPAGVYKVSFDASNLTTGMYIYRIESGDFTATKKMMLVK